MMSLATTNTEDESFIILGSSAGASLVQRSSPVPGRDSGPEAIKMNELMKEFSNEGSLAFKAHFNLDNDKPSPTSLMIASSVMSESTTEEVARRLAELLDENVILRDTLRTNNSSLMEKFQLIASCQEDMMKTHRAHKDKFRETRDLVEKLRSENRKLKDEAKRAQESGKLATSSIPSLSSSQISSSGDSGKRDNSMAYEFVASPDEDTLEKLTSQLELVERQRRQVIAENEKLTWQKESLEHMVDVTTKERNSLRDQLSSARLEASTKENGLLSERQSLKNHIKDLQSQLQRTENLGSIEAEEMMKRDNAIHVLETRISSLQADLKAAQLKLLDMENLKLELSRTKHGSAEAARLYREQMQETQARLREAQLTVFQPIRFSISGESDLQSSEYSQYNDNIRLYDKSLKHLSDLLNKLASGASESLARTLELAEQVILLKMDVCTNDQIKASIVELKTDLEAQHSAALQTTGQVRATVSIFEKIFQDYRDVLKTLNASKNNNETRGAHVDALTAALISRDQQLSNTTEELNQLRKALATVQRESEERDHLRAQMEVYKADFEAERESREKLACDKDSIMSDLRGLQRRNQDLTEQLEEVRRMNPNIFQHATAKRGHASAATPSRPAQTPTRPAPTTPASSRSPAVSTGNMARAKKKKSTEAAGVFDGESSPPQVRRHCPVCDKDFRSIKLLQEHVDQCLL